MSNNTSDHPPTGKGPNILSIRHYDWIKEEFGKLLEAGVTCESHSSWSAPIVVVPK